MITKISMKIMRATNWDDLSDICKKMDQAFKDGELTESQLYKLIESVKLRSNEVADSITGKNRTKLLV
jgi:hypothetical protein